MARRPTDAKTPHATASMEAVFTSPAMGNILAEPSKLVRTTVDEPLVSATPEMLLAEVMKAPNIRDMRPSAASHTNAQFSPMVMTSQDRTRHPAEASEGLRMSAQTRCH